MGEAGRYRPETAAEWLSLCGGGGDDSVRRAACAALAERGLPGPRLERWKYSNIHPRLRGFAPREAESGVRSVCGGDGFVENVGTDGGGNVPEALESILNGRHEVLSRYGDMMLWDLNSLFRAGGVLVDIPADTFVDNPVDISFFGEESGFYSPFLCVCLRKNSHLVVIERHDGKGRYWHNEAAAVVLEEGARLIHIRILEDSEQSLHSSACVVQLGEGAVYESFCFAAGGGFSRVQTHSLLEGEGARCRMDGLALLRGSGHADFTAEAEHAAPSCASDQFVRCVLGGRSRGVFQGKALVRPGARGTDARQLCKALLLEEGAEMDTKPELEIFADDVQCSHGAATGMVDGEALFYLRSRGIGEAEARALLVAAFAAEAVDRIGDETAKALVSERLAAWMESGDI